MKGTTHGNLTDMFQQSQMSYYWVGINSGDI